MNCKTHELPWGETLTYLGPDLSEGPLPAFLYFSLSGEQSLCLYPFNQPATNLKDFPMRTFSLTLPGHGEGFDVHKAIAYWADEMAKGRPILEDFFTQATDTIAYLVEEGFATSVAVGGLSRGAFVATHVAARAPNVRAVLGFSPLTDLTYAEDFASLKEDPRVQALTLTTLIPSLITTSVRFYIGNRDVLVGTRNAFEFIVQLADASHQQHRRALNAELFITPSTGAKGHGTLPPIFQAGSEWIWERLSSY